MRLGNRLQNIAHLLCPFGKVHRTPMHPRLAAFRGRNIQYVGQQQVQVPPAGTDLFKHPQKIFRQAAPLAQPHHGLRQPHQRAKRRADFVAHVGQEQPLGIVGFFRGLFGNQEFLVFGSQSLFSLLAFGDVSCDAVEFDAVGFWIAPESGNEFSVDD
ncbi:MAG: hypothetical protein BWX54_01977 [Verrucomicrobia bacterium ADurb.Bin018]|nr:MAG: hypothetical protein BWX54_01977 [Verrucomicrobia bacterium ADurb.Bin018]